MTIAGLTADAKSISRWMRTECLSSRFYHNSALRLETLMCDLGNKMQNCIQLYNRRPYGVGLIVAGCDDLGPHIYQVRCTKILHRLITFLIRNAIKRDQLNCLKFFPYFFEKK